MDGSINGLMNIDRWRMDGWMNGWMDNEEMDGWRIDQCKYLALDYLRC